MARATIMTRGNAIDATATIASTAILKGNGRIVVGAHSIIEDYVTLDTSSNIGSIIVLEPRVKIKSGAILRTNGGSMRIGARSTIGEYNVIASHGGLTIGRECMFGPYVFVNGASHIIEGTDAFRFQGETAAGVVIEDSVWLGARCSILDGVTIGARSVVGAHSLVLHDLPPGHVAFGQPAKVHRKIERVNHEGVP